MDDIVHDPPRWRIYKIKCRMCTHEHVYVWPEDIIDECMQECPNCGHITCEPIENPNAEPPMESLEQWLQDAAWSIICQSDSKCCRIVTNETRDHVDFETEIEMNQNDSLVFVSVIPHSPFIETVIIRFENPLEPCQEGDTVPYTILNEVIEIDQL